MSVQMLQMFLTVFIVLIIFKKKTNLIYNRKLSKITKRGWKQATLTNEVYDNLRFSGFSEQDMALNHPKYKRFKTGAAILCWSKFLSWELCCYRRGSSTPPLSKNRCGLWVKSSGRSVYSRAERSAWLFDWLTRQQIDLFSSLVHTTSWMSTELHQESEKW